MADQELLREICQHPAEDSPRLAYADWLEGLDPVRVECKHCEGGRKSYCRQIVKGLHNPPKGHSYKDVPHCEGTGTFLDTSNRDRAELIRLQIERVRSGDTLHGADITSAILNRHPEWAKCPCPDCRDEGCGTCHKVGDLLKFDSGGSLQMQLRPITWDRGFIGSVSCRMDEVWETQTESCPQCRLSDITGMIPYVGSDGIRDHHLCGMCAPPGVTGYRRGTGTVSITAATPWARAIVERFPVVRFVVTDREPIQELDAPRWYWQSSNVVSYHQGTQLLPRCVFDALGQDQETGYPTREAALDALHTACADVVRKAVFGDDH